MKILKELLSEGLSKQGNTIHYNGGDNDSSEFKGFTSTHPEKGGKGGYQTNISVSPSGMSYQEEKSIKPHLKDKPNTLKTNIPMFVAFPFDNKADDESSTSHAQPFLQALKGRSIKDRGQRTKGVAGMNNLTFDEKSLQRLTNKGADNIVTMLGDSKYNPKHYDKVMIVPLPSSAPLSKDFANHLQKEMKSDYAKVAPIISKARIAKYGTVGRKGKRSTGEHMNAQDFEGAEYHSPRGAGDRRGGSGSHNRLNQIYGYMSKQIRQKRMTPQEGIKWLQHKEDEMNDEIHKSEQQLQRKDLTPVQRRSIESSKQAFEEENSEYERLHNAFMRTVNNSTHTTPDPNAKQWSMKDASSDKNFAYDFMKVNKGATPTNPNEKTLIILSDDNVESGDSIKDTYKQLFKNNMIHKNTDVVVAAMHEIGGSASINKFHGRGGTGSGGGGAPRKETKEDIAKKTATLQQRVKNYIKNGKFAMSDLNKYRIHNNLANGPEVYNSLYKKAMDHMSQGDSLEDSIDRALDDALGTKLAPEKGPDLSKIDPDKVNDAKEYANEMGIHSEDDIKQHLNDVADYADLSANDARLVLQSMIKGNLKESITFINFLING